jgi:hypothetical protein
MSSDFTKILVKDDRMDCVDNIKYAVIKGGQNVTPSQFKAISISNNQLVFNIQVPSEQTLIDRRVLLSTDLTLTVTSRQLAYDNATPPNITPFLNSASTYIAQGCGYGSVSGLAPYPLHQLMTVASATINNNTVSINMKDVLPAIIRMLDKEELGSYNGMSATATDGLLQYGDQVYGASPALGSTTTLNSDFVGRGSIYLKAYTVATNGTSGVSTEVFTWHLTEPLMLSPWIYCNPKSNGQAFYGIQNMNIVLNIGSDLQRVFRGCGPPNNLTNTSGAATYSLGTVYPSPSGQALTTSYTAAGISLPFITGVTAGSAVNPNMFSADTFLFFTFLTAHPSDLFPARNIVPYYELPRYISTGTAAAPLLSNATFVALTGPRNSIIPGIDPTQGTNFTSQTLQLNQIPDKLIMYIRKTGQTWYDSDSYLPITGISIDFNNNSGLLSAARCEDLYRMSKDNGSNQSWNEWIGFQTCNTLFSNDGLYRPTTPLLYEGPAGSYQPPRFTVVPTSGGVLVLEFGKDIQLIEDFFAPGSLGNFNIRVNVKYQNNNPSIDAGDAIELVMITMNSGVFVCERGTSSTYTGILTRADVLEASEQDSYTRSDVKRLVGSGFLDMLKSGVSKLAPLAKAIAPMVAPHAKEWLNSKGALGQMAAHGIGAMGYGRSGGMSGGGSGGRLQGRYA